MRLGLVFACFVWGMLSACVAKNPEKDVHAANGDGKFTPSPVSGAGAAMSLENAQIQIDDFACHFDTLTPSRSFILDRSFLQAYEQAVVTRYDMDFSDIKYYHFYLGKIPGKDSLTLIVSIVREKPNCPGEGEHVFPLYMDKEMVIQHLAPCPPKCELEFMVPEQLNNN